MKKDFSLNCQKKYILNPHILLIRNFYSQLGMFYKITVHLEVWKLIMIHFLFNLGYSSITSVKKN